MTSGKIVEILDNAVNVENESGLPQPFPTVFNSVFQGFLKPKPGFQPFPQTYYYDYLK